MIIKMTGNSEDQYTKSEGWGAFCDDNETIMSWAGFGTLQSRFNGKFINTLTIGGVGTKPEYRRMGCVRRLFEKAFELAPERGWVVSFLHPFSFSYYRMFGYEKISDHKIIEFPMKALDFVPRCPDLRLLDSEDALQDVLTIFNIFSENRNIMFQRYNARHYSLNPHKDNRFTYIWYDKKGKPASYITLSPENYYLINRMASINLNVYEMAFTDNESLMAILGFIRMYEGELDSVKIHNCAMFPELDFVLRHYTHTKYTIIPDIMGRILNVEEILKANKYPEEKGYFVLKVNDTLEYTKGVYAVEYQHNKAEVRKIADTGKYDIIAEMPALTQLLYGYDFYNAENVRYLPGVDLQTDAHDFFKAFPKRNNGLFEHF
jgi:predicted acetyltransferase